ncbi:MAG TPA: DUF1802 family protein [Nitrosarchaeum sp.]
MKSLKKRATVVNALENGDQTVILRKRGILDADISSDKTIKKLVSFHIWNDSYINERRNWKLGNPMKTLFLKIYKILECNTPLKSEYQDCKSWININEEISNGETVLSDAEIESKLSEFKETIK